MTRLFQVAMSPQAGEMVAETLASGYIGQGPRVAQFEEELGVRLNARRQVLATSSCTAALQLALRSIGVGPGDEVVSTPMTCLATSASIALSGARIVWADVDPATGLIDPDDVAQLVGPRTKAVMAVDWGGRACDYPRLRALGFPVVEDAAHAYLALAEGGDLAVAGGDWVCWSFQAIKHLTTGDGGALLAPTDDDVRRAKLLRWFGLDRESKESFRAGQDVQVIGGKWHMNDIAATVGLANIEGATTRVWRCRDNAEFYGKALAGLDGVAIPPPDPGASWWLYTLRVSDRESFISHMALAGVECGVAHSRNDRQRALKEFWSRRRLAGVDAFDSHQVAIPVGWWVSEIERERIAHEVKTWAHKTARATT